MSYPSST
jgi:beta-glucosidase